MRYGNLLCPLIGCALINVGTFAQTQVDWVRPLENVAFVWDGTRTNDIAVDPWGNLAVTGNGFGPVELPGEGGGSISVPANDSSGTVLVARYRPNGEPAWGHLLGGPGFNGAEGVAMDGNGNVFVCGIFESSFDVDPGPGVTEVSLEVSPRGLFFAKFDSSGTFQHVIRIEVVGGFASGEGFSMAFDANNDLFIGGGYSGVLLIDDGFQQTLVPLSNGYVGFVAKFDPDGHLLNHMVLTSVGWYAEVLDLLVRPNGSFTLAGAFNTSVDIDPSSSSYVLTGAGFTNMFVNYNANFHPVWGTAIPGSGSSQTQHLCAGADGGFMICGDQDQDPFIAALDATGEIQWLRPLSGGEIRGLSAKPDGTFYAELNYIQPMNLDPGGSDLTLSSQGTGFDMGFARYRMDDGSLIEAHGFPCPLSNNLIEIAPFGSSFYLSGTHTGEINVDLFGGENLISINGTTVVKYCELPVLSTSLAGNTLFQCMPGDTLLIASGARSYRWFLEPDVGKPIALGDTLIVPWSSETITYYVVGVDGSCVSTPLAITVAPCHAAGLSAHDDPVWAVRAYPIPTRSTLHIEALAGADLISSAELVDITGRVVAWSSGPVATALDLDVQHLSVGRYQLLLRSANGQRSTLPVVLAE